MSSVAETLPPESPLLEHPAVAQQTVAFLEQQQQRLFHRTDRLLAGLLLFQWLVGVSAYGGAVRRWLHSPDAAGSHLLTGLTVAFGLLLLPLLLALARPGSAWTRHVLAVAQVSLSVVLPQLTGGHVEAGFHVFGALAFLVLYRDWRVLVSGLAVALIDVFAGVVGVGTGGVGGAWGGVGKAGGVLIEGFLLLLYCQQGAREMRWVAEREAFLSTADKLVSHTIAKRQWSEDALRAAHARLHRAHEELDADMQRRAAELAEANETVHRHLSILRAQQEAAVDGILVFDEDGKITTYNRRFCDLWQIPAELLESGDAEALRDHVLGCVEDPQAYLSVLERCNVCPSERYHDEVHLRDGRILDRDTCPVTSEAGQHFGRVWYFRDVTDRRRAEAQILTLNRELSRAYESVTEAYDATITGWSRAMDLRDKETEGHSQRVTDLTLRLAVAVGMSGDELLQIRRGALLHDIGKMGVPDHILLKPGGLTDEEWVIMRQHPSFAHEMLFPIEFLRPAIDIPYCHHEKWDGTGYPRGLKGEEIPLPARMFAVVDVWDALRSDRPYREGWPEEKIKAHIASLAGTHFDPKVVDAFLAVVSENDMLSEVEMFSEMALFGDDFNEGAVNDVLESILEDVSPEPTRRAA